MANTSKAVATPLLSIIKNVSFVVLSLISISLSVYLFIQFSSYPIESILFGALAIAFEGSKLYALVDGHADWLARKTKAAVIKISMYTLLALLSVVASYGFSLGALQRADLDPATARVTHQEQSLERQISEIDGQIANFQNQQARLPDGWVTAAQRLQDSIDDLVERRTDLYDTLYSLEQPDFDLASNAFILIGRSVGISGEMVMFVLLIVLSFSIELCIVFTSPTIEHPTKKKYTYKKKPGPKPGAKKAKPGPKTPKPEAPKKEPETPKEDPTPKKPAPVKKTPVEMINYKAPDPATIPSRTKKPKANVEPLVELMAEYVHSLFDNGEHTHLRAHAEAKEAFKQGYKEEEWMKKGVNLSDEELDTYADRLWKAMINTKGPTGYKLVEAHDHDKSKFIPNYTSELIINIMGKKIADTSKSDKPALPLEG